MELELEKIFFTGEPLKGNQRLKSERPSITEKIVAETLIIQSWKISNINPLILYAQTGEYELDINHALKLNRIQGCYVIKGGKNNIPII